MKRSPLLILERLRESKLHDAPAQCNWVKPFENPFVSRVKRRIDMRIVKFWRSAPVPWKWPRARLPFEIP
jgi:hypothetical protein